MYNIIDSNDKITKIGYDITQFSSNPINRTLFLIYAYQLHCAREASIIISMIDALKGSLNNIFFKSDTLCLSGPAKQASKELIKKLVQKKGDHLTFLKIYDEFKAAPDQKTWARKYGIRLDVLNRADKMVKTYYYKIINLSRAPQLSRVDNVDVKKRIIEALKLSHKHLTAKKMQPVFSKKEVDGQINKDSSLYYYYKRRDLENKNFIYDEMINVSGSWEFSVVTLI